MSRGHDDFLDLPEVRVGRVRTEAEDDGLAGREDSSDVSKALESELPISHGPEKESGALDCVIDLLVSVSIAQRH